MLERQLIEEFSQPIQSCSLLTAREEIDESFARPTMEDIVESLKYSKNKICQEALQQIQRKSPTSLKVTLRVLHEGKNLSFAACIKKELSLTQRFLLGHDFMEGIRALIIDKDQNPQWRPPTLEEVSEQILSSFLAEPRPTSA